ncbi:ATP-binding protein [Ekhidna sp.]|uniref:ATP-binding protein n=1 Tax=Ekhidna sp. TaxID=2608089 RepID=UPI003CCC3AC0
MRTLITTICLFFPLMAVYCQEKVLYLTLEDFNEEGQLAISNNDYWMFFSGNDTTQSSFEINSKGWQQVNPSQITKSLANQNNRIEGWFRIRVRLAEELAKAIDYIHFYNYGCAIDMYVNGELIRSFGSSTNNSDPIDFEFVPDVEYTLEFHYIFQSTNYIAYQLMGPYEFGFAVSLTNQEFHDAQNILSKNSRVTFLITTVASCVLASLFMLLYLQNRELKSLKHIVITSVLLSSIMLVNLLSNPNNITFIEFGWLIILHRLMGLLFALTLYSIIHVFAHVFTNAPPNRHRLIILLTVVAIVALMIIQQILLILSVMSIIIGICVSYIYKSWRNASRSQWAIIIGFLLTFIFMMGFFVSIDKGWINYLFIILTYLSFPISSLFFISYRFNEMISEVKTNADQIIQLTEEKRQQTLNQQSLLEKEVEERTKELNASIEDLKSTQTQLIHSEKMASLGELTAGIAHEIQNPLNFVNNFSELNKELIDELKDAVAKNEQEEVQAILKDLLENETKIAHHGKRAEEIVKSMLQHSRTSSGEKEPTDINALADEYLLLAYHGLRAKDKSFNADFKTELDSSLPKINVIPQDIGRVLLNLINNAFQAVRETEKPIVTVSTKYLPLPPSKGGIASAIQIIVTDNGIGIPDQVRDKIFQPFFTTKAAGEGTGLGLSMSYDIVTKGHGGTIEVESQKDQGTTFTITLPIT